MELRKVFVLFSFFFRTGKILGVSACLINFTRSFIFIFDSTNYLKLVRIAVNV